MLGSTVDPCCRARRRVGSGMACRFAGYDDFALCSLRRRQARGVFTGALAATWKCRRPFPVLLLDSGAWSRWLTFQPQFVEFLAVFKVFTQNRVRRSGLLCRSLTFQFLVVEVSGCLLGFLPEQSTTALHVSPECISERIVEQIGTGGDFPSRRAGPRVVLLRQGSAAAGAEQIADITSSGGTHVFHTGQVSTTSPGPVHVDVHLPDSAEWVELCNATGRTYFWNRRSQATVWKSPPGVRWSASARGRRRVMLLAKTHPCQSVTLSLLCLLSEAHRGEGLGISSPLLGCHLWQTCSVSACCLRRTLWLLDLVASVLCVLLARKWILNMRQSGFWLLFHTFQCEGGPRILRSILGQTKYFL